MNHPAARVLIVLVAALGWACPNRPADGPPGTAPDLRGTITRAGEGEEGRLLVEERPGEASGSNKASLRLTPATRLWARTAEGVRPAERAEFTVGQTVSVWFEGPVAESYPVQATAGTLVLEAGDG